MSIPSGEAPLLKVLLVLLAVPLVLVVLGILGNGVALTQPPGLERRLTAYLTTNVAQTAPDSPFPELRPTVYRASPETLFSTALQTVNQLGWNVITRSPKTREIQAVVTTPLWHFKDDVTVQVRGSAQGSLLHIRSASRVGKGDLGANIRHIVELQRAVAGQLSNQVVTTP